MLPFMHISHTTRINTISRLASNKNKTLVAVQLRNKLAKRKRQERLLNPLCEEEMGQSVEKKVVMVAVDDSECSRYALEWALQNVDSITNSKLVIFTVQPISDFNHLLASTMGLAPPELMTNFQQLKEKHATALLGAAKEICANHGITATTATEAGDPGDKICKAVEEFQVTLLVLGSHGRGAIKRAFLGSVSSYCVHNVKCPVLVVKK